MADGGSIVRPRSITKKNKNSGKKPLPTEDQHLSTTPDMSDFYGLSLIVMIPTPTPTQNLLLTPT